MVGQLCVCSKYLDFWLLIYRTRDMQDTWFVHLCVLSVFYNGLFYLYPLWLFHWNYGQYHVQYIPRNMHTVFALLCFVVVIHWLIFPYPSGLLHWHCGNLTIAPVPATRPWWLLINTSCEFIMNDCITTTKQSTTKTCAYFLGYTVILKNVGNLPTSIHYEQIRSTKSYTCTYCMVCTVFCTQVSISAKLMGRTLPRHFSDHIDVTYVGIGARVVNQLLFTQKMTRSTVINCMFNINIFICLPANIQQIHYHCNIKLRYIISQYPFTCIVNDAYTMLLHFSIF